MIKIKVILLALALLVNELAVINVAQAQTTPEKDQALETQLTDVAKDALNTESEVHVTGNIETALKKRQRASRFQSAIRQRLEKHQKIHAFLASRREGFTDFKNDLSVEDFKVNGNTAILYVKEHTLLGHIPKKDRTKDIEEYIKEHRFTFTKQNDQWILSSDQVLNSTQEPDPTRLPDNTPKIPVPPDAIQLILDPPNEQSSKPPELIASASPNLQGILTDLYSITNIPKSDWKFKAVPQVALNSLSRGAMVDYIFRYALNYNTNYRNFESGGGSSGDCTNFVSQVMRAGGWSDVLPEDYSSRANTSLWWYGEITQTYTWASASHFYEFLRGSGRTTPKSHSSDLVPGDVIQVDWGQGEGLSHTMVVSTKYNDGTILVSYHTNPHLKQYLSELVQRFPNGHFYAWHINDSF